ncbi:MAG: hypothetical protein AABW58_01215 [Nanoarchaeota archaeon]
MNKKGMEITFNWIFVIIAGSVLLMFFLFFAWKQIGLFNKLGINEVVSKLNNEIDSFAIGVSLNKVVELPKGVDISFKCGEVVFKGAKKDTLHLIYAEGDFRERFNLWTNAWVFPFKVDNLYYTTNSNGKMFIIGNENFFFNIPNKFPKSNNLNQEVGKNDVIVDFTNSNLQRNYRENKVLVIDSSRNMITFFPENKKEEFYGEEMIYGGIFSSYTEYSCLRKKALERLNVISELYKKKAGLLKLNSKCNFLYSEMEKTLELFKREPLKFKNVLIEQNDNLKRSGCASVF